MKKQLILLLPLSLVFVASCSGSPIYVPPVDDSDTINFSSSEEAVKPVLSLLKEDEYKSFYTYYYERINELTSFKSVTVGKTESTANQSIDATFIKGDYSYLINKSSGMVNTSHEAYYHNDKTVFKDNGKGDFAPLSKTDYLTKYGTCPLDNYIEGYIVNEDTIKEISLVKQNNGLFLVTLSLDKDSATSKVKTQMKEFGGLLEEPVFTSDITLKLTLKDDCTPVSIDLESRYNAKKRVVIVVDASCHQTYTVTFSNINEQIEIPKLDSVKSLLD